MKYGALVAALMLAACSDSSEIEDAIRVNLVDPESARFGEITKYTDKRGDQMACLTVNSKNRMGGYGGQKVATAVQNKDGTWQMAGGLREYHQDCQSYLEFLKENDL